MSEFSSLLLNVAGSPVTTFVLACLVGPPALWFAYRALPIRSLGYEVLLQSQVLTVKEKVAGKILVLYEGRPVTDLRVIQLRIHNTGNQDIDTNDLTEPISFTVGEGATILSAEPIGSDPERLIDSVAYNDVSATLPAVLLNRKDEILIELIVQKCGSIAGHARGPGVRGIPRRDLMGTRLRWVLVATIFALAIGILLTISGVLIAGRSAPLNVLQEIGVWVMVGGYLALSVLMVVSGELRRALFTKPRWRKVLR